MRPSRAAFSKAEVVALVAIVGLIGLVLLPLGRTRYHGGYRSSKDARNLKQISTALVTFAQQNHGLFPTPSLLDKNHATLQTPESEAFKKDTTGNTLSILIWNDLVNPETTYSPAEASGEIYVDDGYQSTNPAAAAKPSDALWDPGFAGTPTQVASVGTAAARRAGKGNNSYAHALPFGARGEARWKNTLSTREAVVGNRGAGWTRDDAGAWRLNASGAVPPGVDSVTLLIHGGRNSWEGNVAYNDAHVDFEARPDREDIAYKRRAGSGLFVDAPDNLFVNEADDATNPAGDPLGGTNNWLLMISQITGDEAARTLTTFHD